MLHAPNGLLTTKQTLRLDELVMASGDRLREVTIGYETYGQLNEARDNAVLVCHFFSGCSHAAGRYQPSDPLPGWWDSVIGPGKAIDTERWFVIAPDALGCMRLDAPHGVTTNPASLNPATGKPYGPDFPPLAIADMVESQRQLLHHLGIQRLAAVAGPSLGAMQALDWAIWGPLPVERVIAAISPADFQAPEIGLYCLMEDAIQLDPRYKQGRYDPNEPPLEGLGLALKLMLHASGGRAEWNTRLDRKPAQTAEWAVEAWLDNEGRTRGGLCDANAWIAMLRANMRWELGRGQLPLEQAIARISARVLLIPSAGDALLPTPHYHARLAAALQTAGSDHEICILPATYGHLAGLADIAQAADAIRRCLETPIR